MTISRSDNKWLNDIVRQSRADIFYITIIPLHIKHNIPTNTWFTTAIFYAVPTNKFDQIGVMKKTKWSDYALYCHCRMVANWKCYLDIRILCSLSLSRVMDLILYVIFLLFTSMLLIYRDVKIKKFTSFKNTDIMGFGSLLAVMWVLGLKTKFCGLGLETISP